MTLLAVDFLQPSRTERQSAWGRVVYRQPSARAIAELTDRCERTVKRHLKGVLTDEGWVRVVDGGGGGPQGRPLRARVTRKAEEQLYRRRLAGGVRALHRVDTLSRLTGLPTEDSITPYPLADTPDGVPSGKGGGLRPPKVSGLRPDEATDSHALRAIRASSKPRIRHPDDVTGLTAQQRRIAYTSADREAHREGVAWADRKRDAVAARIGASLVRRAEEARREAEERARDQAERDKVAAAQDVVMRAAQSHDVEAYRESLRAKWAAGGKLALHEEMALFPRLSSSEKESGGVVSPVTTTTDVGIEGFAALPAAMAHGVGVSYPDVSARRCEARTQAVRAEVGRVQAGHGRALFHDQIDRLRVKGVVVNAPPSVHETPDGTGGDSRLVQPQAQGPNGAGVPRWSKGHSHLLTLFVLIGLAAGDRARDAVVGPLEVLHAQARHLSSAEGGSEAKEQYRGVADSFDVGAHRRDNCPHVHGGEGVHPPLWSSNRLGDSAELVNHDVSSRGRSPALVPVLRADCGSGSSDAGPAQSRLSKRTEVGGGDLGSGGQRWNVMLGAPRIKASPRVSVGPAGSLAALGRTVVNSHQVESCGIIDNVLDNIGHFVVVTQGKPPREGTPTLGPAIWDPLERRERLTKRSLAPALSARSIALNTRTGCLSFCFSESRRLSTGGQEKHLTRSA